MWDDCKRKGEKKGRRGKSFFDRVVFCQTPSSSHRRRHRPGAAAAGQHAEQAAGRATPLRRSGRPDEVAAAYSGERPKYGPNYIIPVPFDPRLIWTVPSAVAQAAMDTGVARKPITDMPAYIAELAVRLNPTAASLQAIFDVIRNQPKRRIVFAEGEEEKTIRAALQFRDEGLGIPILIGREERIAETMARAGLTPAVPLEIRNARTSTQNAEYTDLVYSRLQRRGYLHRDCQRMINLDRNVFGAAIVASGHADGMVTGLTRTYSVVLEEIRRVIDPKPDQLVMGVSIIIARGRTVLVADTNVTELPTAQEIADIAQTAARVSRKLGQEPRVALLAYSTFGNPMSERSENMRKAKTLLDQRGVDFDYDGEMSADVALNRDVMKLYPFSKLKEPANVLIMPAIHSANISTKLLHELGGSVVIGPLLVGLSKPIQIVPMGSTVSDLVQIAAFSAFDLTG